MGSYLSEPIKDKESSDFEGDKLICGASSMQGWRETQEDAHNCFIDFDENGSFFAVYDGHGGHEVAKYAADHLPNFIKETESYKNGDYEKALIDAFLGFDETLTSRKVITILKQIASKDIGKGVGDDAQGDQQNDEDVEDEEDEEENLDNLCKEAHMPLEQLMDKYRNESTGRLQFNSPNLRPKRLGAGTSGAGTSASTSATSSSGQNNEDGEVSSSSNSGAEKSSAPSSLTNGEVEVNGDISNDVNGDTSEAGSSDKVNGKTTDKTPTVGGSGDGSSSLPDSSSQSQTEDKNVSSSNGELNDLSDESDKITSSSSEKKEFLVRSASLTRKLLNNPGEDSSDSDSEDDETFEGAQEDSSDEEDGVEQEGEGDVEEDDEEEDDDDDDDDDDEDEEEYMDDEVEACFGLPYYDKPGSDSGCTAVVALLKGRDLYVANAGDSRCVVCRDGKAVEMSIDHKPEDKIEMDRIVAAGGKVSGDGRVNGGLNLSRALGDHTYKRVKTLPATEQMITALPDVKKLEIDPVNDEFIVLACDGIWNFMTSQEVVDFIRPKLNEKQEKISSICEELFDHCLAPNTLGDGTGCDNMTCIIIKFKSAGINGHESVKRPATIMEDTSTDNSETATKRQKTDDTPVETAAV